MEYEFYNNFQDFIKSIIKSNKIFRGHSDADWKLESTYRRSFKDKPFSEWCPYGFKRISHSNIISNYDKIPEYKELSELNSVDLLIYLQHYGFPTPLLDFTKDPLIALYFAGSSINYTNFRSTFEYGERNNQLALKVYNRQTLSSEELEQLFKVYPKFFVDVIEIDLTMLSNVISDVGQEADFNQELINCNTYNINSKTNVVFSIQNPQTIDLNKNLLLQKGSFIFIDSEYDLEEFFEQLVRSKELKGNPITHHLIPKPSLNYPDASVHNLETAFEFLSRNEVSGKNLFNDLQGLKFDMNYISGI